MEYMLINLANIFPRVQHKMGGNTGIITNPNPLTVYWGKMDFKPVFTHPDIDELVVYVP